ncbi:nucleoside 2-deoxyribosyltransferase [Methanoculleus taiwanensis]|uniref:Nucleoside 2-deoxyribosyltransferase n=1 Tax=Methanoculleus taiwanensis TaxID=1550565 RepID=A0A498H1H3_9EURY|nr:nucleoside 2-deoxyribosyltransferase [Methanoculleus taiwanensis]RXE56791.1 nucleoside 2-deoxyribosyltransferase [Methanoculleus taiwanensis]
MYVLVSPCILNPACRARGITTEEDKQWFSRALERCRKFGIEVVALPCPESIYLGTDRSPGSYLDRLATPAFEALLDDLAEQVRKIVHERGEPLCIVGVDSSPACGVTATYYSSEKQPGRGAFLARFSDIRAFDVKTFARHRIYLAGPLFTEAELAYNLVLYDLLTRHLFDVYLPQEVGDNSSCRDREEHRAIFDRHVRALREADIVVAVCDGADADSGTAWEMGYAYALGKPVIVLRTDFRMAGRHECVNLMLEESAVVVLKKEDLPVALDSPLA